MIIIFKIIGCYLGFRMAPFFGSSGFMGAAVGVLLGHAFDAVFQVKIMRARARRIWQARAKEQFGRTFLNSLFLMFGKLCAVDGPINKEEISAVEKVMNDMLSLNKKARRQAIEIFKRARSSESSFQYDAAQFFDLYQSEPQIRENMIDLFLQVAAVDGRVNEPEERLVRSAAHIFNVGEERYLQMRSRYPLALPGGNSGGYSANVNLADSDRFYTILGCKKTDPVSVIKQNYRKLASDYHPDKIMSKNLPEDFTKFATEKFKTIQEAYEAVKNEKGFN